MARSSDMKARQLQWATKGGKKPDEKGYLGAVADNFFVPLSADAVREFGAGSGGEMKSRKDGRPPKMCALHSSSVLACNVFDYWRASNGKVVASALGLKSPVKRMEFEAQFPTGLPGSPPNLDVGLWLESGAVWGIESKFTEPYGGKKRKGQAFKDKYFPKGEPIWSQRGLPRSGKLAKSLQKDPTLFEYLDAAQLLKHILGLHAASPGTFTLGYLYMTADEKATTKHEVEIASFIDSVAGEVPMVAMRYGDLLDRMTKVAGPEHQKYFAYIGERYFE